MEFINVDHLYTSARKMKKKLAFNKKQKYDLRPYKRKKLEFSKFL